MILLILCAGGYLLGSVPFGLVLTRAAGMGDIRAIGSGNIGATNVLRTGNKGLALATLLLDGFKGTLAVLIAAHFGVEPGYAAGLAAFLGHLFPVWLGFKGGKGVATGLGVFFGAAWPLGAVACLTWLTVALITRYSSLAAIITFCFAPVYGFIFGGPELAGLCLVIAALVFWKHQANLARLRAGTEPKIGKKAAA